MARLKVTKKAVEACPPADKDVILWDAELKGFGCKITPAGRRVYFLYYRTRTGLQRRPAIGAHGAVTAEQARDIARRWLAEVAAGGDPSSARRTLRNSPTMADLCRRFLDEHASLRNKGGTFYNYHRMIDRFVLPTLGNKRVVEVSRGDVLSLHHQLRDTPYQANRVLGLVSKMMNLAERWGLREDGSNPTRHVEKYRERHRERYLSQEELVRLGDALKEAEREATEDRFVIAAIRLLLFTGCRLSEILELRWPWVNLERKRLELPDSKTGAKLIFLNEPAIEVLTGLPRVEANPFVVPGAKAGQHLVNLQKPWRRIRKAANLSDVRIHDLRHNYASVAAGLGEGLPMIGKLLGHSQAQTTHRYAHLAADPVIRASERVGAAISSAMRRSDTADTARVAPTAASK